ncbi:helix-turn-helix domain-containing protein [Amycolatopsis minnesotensis]|uniref:HTH cro/C1-type domain-containing protein n=1 Tax=Amycolatopsis minnesotensis TaxID=337894 RepID=A0ABN2RTH9_9PSEU
MTKLTVVPGKGESPSVDRAYCERVLLAREPELIAFVSLGARLRHLRVGHGLSRKELAEKSGLDADTVANMESDHVMGPRRLLELLRVAEPLGVEAKQLVLLAADDLAARSDWLSKLAMYEPDSHVVEFAPGRWGSRLKGARHHRSEHGRTPLGVVLRRMRRQADMKLADCAQRARRSVSGMCDVENGRRQVSTVDSLVGWSVGLWVPLDDLTEFVIEHRTDR